MGKRFVIQNYEKFVEKLYSLGTPADIALKIHCPRSTVNNWLSKRRKPSSENLKKLIKEYNLQCISKCDGKCNKCKEYEKCMGIAEREDKYDTVGKRLKKFLDENDISQKEFAEVIGVEKSTVSNWISDTYKIEFTKLQKIAKEFEISLDYLLMNNSEERNFELETGLIKDTVLKLANIEREKEIDEQHKLFLNATTDIYIVDITEIDILNFIVSKTDLFEFLKPIVQRYVRIYKEKQELKKTSLKKLIFEEDRKKLDEELRHIEEDLSHKVKQELKAYCDKYSDKLQ